jgi:8-oxo-dGTP diphosphatase
MKRNNTNPPMIFDAEENINTWMTHIGQVSKAAISVDCVIFGYNENTLKVLVLECNMPPFEKLPSLVGDLIQGDESLEEAAARVLFQRTGLGKLYLEQVNTFSAPDRHPLGRVVSTAFYSLMQLSDYEPQPLEYENVYWLDINEIDNMAFDHKEILEFALKRLKRTVKEKPIGFNLLPSKFTLLQLQSLYENILGVKLDKRNFRRKLKSLDILIEHKELQTDVSHRPAKLYSFDKKLYQEKHDRKLNLDF